jgi:hypothetical protein
LVDRVLPKRLTVNIKEGLKHRAAFEAFNTGLEALRPEEVAEWRASVIKWEATQHTDSSESPFELEEDDEGEWACLAMSWETNHLAAMTLRKIQLAIATEEFICTDDGVEIEREHSPGAFITMGLELEEVQSVLFLLFGRACDLLKICRRRLEVDVHVLKDPTPTQKLAFMKRRTALLKRIHKFREIQRVYMPVVHSALNDVQRQMLEGNGEQVPEATRLFMPSEIESADVRRNVCAIRLPQLEVRLREAEEALEAVRQGLRTRTMTNRFRLRNYTGQGMMTKGQGILRQINIRIHIAKLRYRYACAALLALQGHGDWEGRLRVLRDEDVRALNERALTDEEKAQNEHWAEIGGAIIEGGIRRAAGVASGEGSHTLSWIWYTVGVDEDSDEKDPRFHSGKSRFTWVDVF